MDYLKTVKLADNKLYYFFQINNPDMRVVILKEYAQKNFPATPILDYAIEVEKITTSKVNKPSPVCPAGLL